MVFLNAVAVVRKSKNGALYLDIPNSISEQLGIKPFMTAKMKAENGQIRIFDFQKTVKIKLDLDKKTIARVKKIMKMKGYGSIDETVCNVVDKAFARENKKEREMAIVYVYPTGFLESKFVLIDDYEKSFKTKNRQKNQKTA